MPLDPDFPLLSVFFTPSRGGSEMRRGALLRVLFLAWLNLVGISSWVSAQEVIAEKAQNAEQKDAETQNLEPIVVTADRLETAISEVTKSISVVGAKERDEQQQFYLPELIDDEPGVFLLRLGGPGQWSAVSIRGAGSQYTQFQYNGFPLRDTADTQGTLQYFIEDMYSGTNLRQVEILKGTQSTLYGSQAMGGVVNIIPDKWKKGLGAELRSEFGDFMTFIGNGRAFYGQDNYYVDINPVGVHTDGQKNGGENGYYYDNIGYTGGAGVKFGQNMALEYSSILYSTKLALSERNPSLDANGNLLPNLASADEYRRSILALNGVSFTQGVSSLYDYSIKGAYTATQRHYHWSKTDGDQSNYDGSNAYLETQHNIHPTDWLTLVIGADSELSYYNGREPKNTIVGDYSPVYFDKNWYQIDLFGQARFKFLDESLFLNLGARYVDHEVFDPKGVGEVSAAYLVRPFGTKVHVAYGTGYRTPSLYEIYGGHLWNGQLITIGNPKLKPESSSSYEFGIDQSLVNNRVTLGLTWFHTDFDNLINYDGFANKYINAAGAQTEGVETYLTLSPFKWLNMKLAYTYADSTYQDNKSGEWLRRNYLPRSEVSATATVFPWEGVTAAMRIGWQGDRLVPLYTPTYSQVLWEEPSSMTVDMALTYRFLKYYEVWLRAENLFNENYTQSGYIMPGRWLYGGVKLSF